ncbi:GL20229 [Drosophila persimilis]|uniref:GL20229 n=1 Tax=Drosophila persimilis TaxID=7234 RepID=B4GXP9_DROPE|nr:GL20229 [Drosophila persimilis]
MPQRVASPGDDSQRERTVAATVVGRRLVGRVLNATIVMGAIGRRVKARSVSSTGWASVGVCNLLSTTEKRLKERIQMMSSEGELIIVDRNVAKRFVGESRMGNENEHLHFENLNPFKISENKIQPPRPDDTFSVHSAVWTSDSSLTNVGVFQANLIGQALL